MSEVIVVMFPYPVVVDDFELFAVPVHMLKQIELCKAQIESAVRPPCDCCKAPKPFNWQHLLLFPCDRLYTCSRCQQAIALHLLPALSLYSPKAVYKIMVTFWTPSDAAEKLTRFHKVP